MPSANDIVIPCPGCGKPATTVMSHTLTYYDPRFRCKCGYKKPLYWRKPQAAKQRKPRTNK